MDDIGFWRPFSVRLADAAKMDWLPVATPDLLSDGFDEEYGDE